MSALEQIDCAYCLCGIEEGSKSIKNCTMCRGVFHLGCHCAFIEHNRNPAEIKCPLCRVRMCAKYDYQDLKMLKFNEYLENSTKKYDIIKNIIN